MVNIFAYEILSTPRELCVRKERRGMQLSCLPLLCQPVPQEPNLYIQSLPSLAYKLQGKGKWLTLLHHALLSSPLH